MSIKLTENEFKEERNKIQVILTNLQTNFKSLEEVLLSLSDRDKKNYPYLFEEFHKHGQELIDFLTNEKIEELYKK